MITESYDKFKKKKKDGEEESAINKAFVKISAQVGISDLPHFPFKQSP